MCDFIPGAHRIESASHTRVLISRGWGAHFKRMSTPQTSLLVFCSKKF